MSWFANNDAKYHGFHELIGISHMAIQQNTDSNFRDFFHSEFIRPIYRMHLPLDEVRNIIENSYTSTNITDNEAI